MKPVRYIFINKGLGMSAGKIGAQAAHAEMLALNDYHSIFTESGPSAKALFREWVDSGHYTKLVMEARDSEHLKNIQTYLEARGHKTYLVIDEGRTEIEPFSPTALGVHLVDKDDPRTQQHFGNFRVYKDRPLKKKKKPAPRFFNKS